MYGKPDEDLPSPPPPVDPSGGPTEVPPTPPMPPGDDGNCAGRIDAIEVAADGQVYSFRHAKVYKLNHEGIEPGWPKLISQVGNDIYGDNERKQQ